MNNEKSKNKGNELNFLEHLEVFRFLILKIFLVFFFFSLISFIFIDEIYLLLIEPLKSISKTRDIILNFSGPLDAVIIKIKSGIIFGFISSLPFILFLIWKFVLPGLKKREIKFALTTFITGFILFIVGTVLAFFSIEVILNILLSFTIDNVKNIWTLNTYFNFIIFWLISLGLIFEIPVLVFLLSSGGIIKIEKLKKGRPYALIIFLTISAVITPPDPLTQILMTVPMLLLYEAGLLMAKYLK